MGRPLKVQKYQQDTNTNVDYGFPNDGQPDNGYSDNQPGVTGGWDGYIRCSVNLTLPGAGTIEAATDSDTVTGTDTQFDQAGINGGAQVIVNGTVIGTVSSVDSATQITLDANAASNVSGVTYSFNNGVQDGYILRQKGKSKYLVALANTIEDEGIAQGGTYFISSASDTDWAALGAGTTAGYGQVFTATASGAGLSTNGQVAPAAVCQMVANNGPAPGEFYVEVYNDGDTYYASTLTNHWVESSENTETKYVATIFNDSGNVDPATGYTLVGIENWC